MTFVMKQSIVDIVPVESTVSDEHTGPQQSYEALAVRDGITAEEFSADSDRISQLAYSFWQGRGCPIGSPEEDWLLAEQAIQLYRLRKQVGSEPGPQAIERAMSKSA